MVSFIDINIVLNDEQPDNRVKKRKTRHTEEEHLRMMIINETSLLEITTTTRATSIRLLFFFINRSFPFSFRLPTFTEGVNPPEKHKY